MRGKGNKEKIGSYANYIILGEKYEKYLFFPLFPMKSPKFQPLSPFIPSLSPFSSSTSPLRALSFFLLKIASIIHLHLQIIYMVLLVEGGNLSNTSSLNFVSYASAHRNTLVNIKQNTKLGGGVGMAAGENYN